MRKNRVVSVLLDQIFDQILVTVEDLERPGEESTELHTYHNCGCKLNYGFIFNLQAGFIIFGITNAMKLDCVAAVGCQPKFSQSRHF
jgi:hypothetical protein